MGAIGRRRLLESAGVLLAAGRISAGNVDRKSTRLNSSHGYISYAVFCLNKKRIGRATLNAGHAVAAARAPDVAFQHPASPLLQRALAGTPRRPQHALDEIAARVRRRCRA